MCMAGTPLPNNIDPEVFTRFRSLRQAAKARGVDVPKPCYAQPRFEPPKDEPAAKARAGPTPLPDDGVQRCTYFNGRKYCGSEYCRTLPDGSFRCKLHDEVLQQQRAAARARKRRELAELELRAEWRRDNPGVPFPDDEGGGSARGSGSESESGSERGGARGSARGSEGSLSGDFLDDDEPEDAGWRDLMPGRRRQQLAQGDSDSSDDGRAFRFVPAEDEDD